MPRRAAAPVLRAGLIGSGQSGELYARALTHLPGVDLAASCGIPSLGGGAGRTYPDAISLLDGAAIDAVILASPAGDAQALVRRALLRRRHVLSTGPYTLNAGQTERLAALARRAGCLLMFGEERFLSPAFEFLERAAAFSDGSAGPRYLRLLHVQGRGRRAGLRLAHLAVEDLAACLRLVRRTPRLVVAAGTKASNGALQAAFINMLFRGGAVASAQVSIAEVADARQTVVALARRTLVLDELDPHQPLRIMSDGLPPPAKVVGEGPQSEAGVSHTDAVAFPGEPFDGPRAQVRRFLDTLASAEGRPERVGNSELWSRAAALWEAAAGSVALGGAPVPVGEWSVEEPARQRERPPHLRVIVGGREDTASTALNGRRPDLRVLSN